MGVDKEGVSRTSCTACECKEYIWEKAVRCAYCGCPPLMHLVEKGALFTRFCVMSKSITDNLVN